MKPFSPHVGKRACKDCVAFDLKDPANSAGLCKANAPTLYIIPLPVKSLAGQGIAPQEFTGWPVVTETAWCMDFVQTSNVVLNG